MKLRIGTRKSPLALWQANHIKDKIQKLNPDIKIEIIEISSDGDQNLVQPLYGFGITGVFTKSLDTALVNDKIDLAVHSLKDIPTSLANGLELSSVLARDYNQDMLVFRNDYPLDSLDWSKVTIATGSLRRRAFLANKYPKVRFKDIRGNVQTRLKKMREIKADATVLSKAGLKRMNLITNSMDVDFMFPSVGQGCIAVVSSESCDNRVKLVLEKLGCKTTEKITSLERHFLKTMEGGCSAPIGIRIKATTHNHFKVNAALLSLDGKDRLDVTDFGFTLSDDCLEKGKELAHRILAKGGDEMMVKIKKEIAKTVGKK